MANSSSDHQDNPLISNDRFKIVFDIYTPRPHFIILFQNPSQIKQVNDLDEEDLKKMLQLIELFIQKFKLTNQNIILSFHTGRWATKTNLFHAHISVALDIYLNIFNGHGTANLEGYRKGAFNNRCWNIKPTDGKPMRTTYIENVRNYMISNAKTSNEYRLDEIKGCLQANVSDNRIVTNSNFRIEFDSREPKIYLKSGIRSSVESRSILIKEMCRIANEHGFLGRSNGSHICVDLSSHENLNGYIHTSGDYVYQLHPDRDQFLRNYRNHNSYFIHT